MTLVVNEWVSQAKSVVGAIHRRRQTSRLPQSIDGDALAAREVTCVHFRSANPGVTNCFGQYFPKPRRLVI